MPAQTLEIPKRWPLVNRFQSRDIGTPITRDARLVNCYAELDPEDNEYYIYKRLGISPAPLYTSTGNGMGLYTYTFPQGGPPFQIIAVFGRSVQVSSGASLTTVGTLPGLGVLTLPSPAFFETVNSNPPTVVVQNGAGGAIYTPSTMGYAAITDATFTSINLAGGWAYLDGTLYVMDTLGNIFGTAGLNNAAVWSGTNVIPASSQADGGVCIVKQLSYVVALKQWTAQPFWDAGNPVGSPLSPIPNAQIPYGCYSAYTVQKIDEIVFWVTANQVPSAQVVMMENLSTKIISVPAVDRVLTAIMVQYGQGAVANPGIWSWTTKHAGHRWYGLSFQNLNISLVYDLDQKLWYIWTDPNGNFWPVAAMTYTPSTVLAQGQHIIQHTSNGNLYTIAANIYSDINTAFPVDIYTPNVTVGTQRIKQLNMLYFLADKVQGQLLARYSDDDYITWSNFRAIDLFDDRPLLDQDGSFYRRAYNFRYLTNNKFRIKSSDLQLDIGTL